MSHTLILCGHYPLPEDIGASIRTMNFVRFFRQRGEVDIAYSHELPGAPTGNPIFANEYRLHTREYSTFKTQVLHRLISGIPSPIYEWDDAARRLLSSLIQADRYDHILVRYLYSTAPLLSMKPRHVARTIVDFDDLLSGPLYDSPDSRSATGIRRQLVLWNRRRLKKYERDCLKFGASLFCSEQDRQAMLLADKRSSTFVVPNVYSDPAFAGGCRDGFGNANTLLYVGTLSYGPNRDGLRWFVESIFPTFARTYPNARLLVVGRSPDAETKRLCESDPNIELHSDAPDVKPYYERARAVVVPVLTGGGTRIKILEAALAQRPVLSTAFGAGGLEMVPERDFLSFADAGEFARQYGKLLGEEAYRGLTRNARDLVLRRYSGAAFDSAMETVLNAVEAGIRKDASRLSK